MPDTVRRSIKHVNIKSHEIQIHIFCRNCFEIGIHFFFLYFFWFRYVRREITCDLPEAITLAWKEAASCSHVIKQTKFILGKRAEWTCREEGCNARRIWTSQQRSGLYRVILPHTTNTILQLPTPAETQIQDCTSSDVNVIEVYIACIMCSSCYQLRITNCLQCVQCVVFFVAENLRDDNQRNRENTKAMGKPPNKNNTRVH